VRVFKPHHQVQRLFREFQSALEGVGRQHGLARAQEGPPIIPKRTALIWPGLSLSHFLQNAIPAWSLQGRNLTQTFGKWVFDSNTQCKESTTIDTAVCADVSDTTIAAVPWLGGDYNPWWVFWLCFFIVMGPCCLFCTTTPLRNLMHAF
jgi:hypothetical protein